MELEALDHVGLVVADMARSVRWYQEVLFPSKDGCQVEITTYEPAPA
jgi:glyoxalase/bleomycin resistance protein/dioxygenase superfamily protein